MKSTQFLKIAAGVVAAVTLYVLSIGPVAAICFVHAKLHHDVGGSLSNAEKRLLVLYDPLFRLADREPMKSALLSYMGFWLRIARVPAS